mmetsp:Transcript_54093/g.139297  ORF Transcript_54093/g.139297 Transcript_54093/m.139297 type:complete len:218 (+) Transcript_54093:858-1511(+)
MLGHVGAPHHDSPLVIRDLRVRGQLHDARDLGDPAVPHPHRAGGRHGVREGVPLPLRTLHVPTLLLLADIPSAQHAPCAASSDAGEQRAGAVVAHVPGDQHHRHVAEPLLAVAHRGCELRGRGAFDCSVPDPGGRGPADRLKRWHGPGGGADLHDRHRDCSLGLLAHDHRHQCLLCAAPPEALRHLPEPPQGGGSGACQVVQDAPDAAHERPGVLRL